ncbi:MAG TPA: hypothetical protein VEU27_04925 [Gemmatimonadales bacterium]|nr:hypothetical protein [Gemmatimonadales bacterium]
MHPSTRSPLLLPALAAAALGLAACSSTSTTGPTTPAMSQAEANAAADVIVSDISDQTDGATSTSSSPSFSMVAAPVTTPSLAVAASGAWYFTACSPAPTVTVNGSTTSYVFDNCAISRLVPLETLTRNGQVDVTLGAGSRTLVFTNFEKMWERVSFLTGQSITTSATLNGTRSISDDGTTLQHHVYGTGDPASSLFQTNYVFADQSTAEHQRNWQGTFTADVASSIVPDQPLPAGMWSVTGNSTFTRNQGTSGQKVWTFSTTGSGVHYNPACTSAPQFDAGTLTVQAVNAQTGTTTTFTITFTACGQYSATITKS